MIAADNHCRTDPPDPTPAPAPKPNFFLIGVMRATASGRDLLPRGRKTRGMLAYLCLAQGRRVSRSRLAALLWDRSPEAQARMSVRHALSELSASLDEHKTDVLEIDREGVRLDLDHCWVDVLALLESARGGGGFETGEVLGDVTERLLEDLDGLSVAFDQWLANERARFGNHLRGLLESELTRLIDSAAAAERRAAAARRLVTFEPTNEFAVRALMKAFVELDDRAQAIREYERAREVLRTALDIGPSKETTTLYQAIRVFPSGTAAMTARIVEDARLTPLPSNGNQPRPASPAPRRKAAESRAGFPSGNAEPEGPASVAVLPLRIIGGDTAHDYLADGIVEDVIEALSRVPSFFVVSRLSTLAFQEQARQSKEIGIALGVRYVLSGSFRSSKDRVRVTVELTDTRTGVALWLSKFDEPVSDVFDLQDRMSEGIVRRIAPYLFEAELKRSRSKRPESLEAYDLFLRGLAYMHNSSQEVYESAREMFQASIAKQPDYALAHAWLAYWHVLRVGQGWSPDRDLDAAQAALHAEHAIRCDSTEPMALAVHGHLVAYLHRDFDLAFQRFERAMSINPNSAPVWLWSAAAHAWMGNAPVAIEQIHHAMALTPFDPLMYAYSGIAGVAYLVAEKFGRAVEFGLRCMQENRTYTSAYRVLAMAYALDGRINEARATVRQLLALEPSLTVERFRLRYPGNQFKHCDMFCDALARAGVPLNDET